MKAHFVSQKPGNIFANKYLPSAKLPITYLAFYTVVVMATLFLIGCTTTSDMVIPTAISPQLDAPKSTEIAPTLLPSVTDIPLQITPLPTVSPTPRPTPRPIINLAVPPNQAADANAALQILSPTSKWDWQLLIDSEPESRLDDGSAQIALVANDQDEVFSLPLVVSVPFTTNWENTSSATVQDIREKGHPLAVIQPWHDLTPQQKALRVDGRHPTDPDYPFKLTWSLLNMPGFASAMTELKPVLSAQMNKPQLHLTAVGDLMLARGLGTGIQNGNLAYPFTNISDWLQKADITIGNLESALGDIGQPEFKRYPFEAPPEAAKALAQAGFDIITLANNHAMDFGPEALAQGIELLRANNVGVIGAGNNAGEAYQPFFIEMHGLRLAFLGYVNVPIEASTGFDTQVWTAAADRPGLAWGEPDKIFADVTAVRSQADLTIVVLHSGLEYIEEPSEAQVAAAQSAIDAGADLVIGHHSHILQGIHFYKDGVIVYGLGNFAFQIEGNPETAVLNVWLDQNGVRQIELLPAIIEPSGQPRPATFDEAGKILQRVHFLTAILNAK